jgi:transposase
MARKYFTADFKAKVALEAIKDELTLAELAAKHGVHPTQVKDWKSALVSQAERTFSKKGKDDADKNAKYIEALERKTGRQSIELDFLKKNLKTYPKLSE